MTEATFLLLAVQRLSPRSPTSLQENLCLLSWLLEILGFNSCVLRSASRRVWAWDELPRSPSPLSGGDPGACQMPPSLEVGTRIPVCRDPCSLES